MTRLAVVLCVLCALCGCVSPDLITVRDVRTRPVNMEIAWQEGDLPDRFGGFAKSLTTLGELAATAFQPWAGVAVAAIEMGGFFADRATDVQTHVTDVAIPYQKGPVGVTLTYDERGQLREIHVRQAADVLVPPAGARPAGNEGAAADPAPPAALPPPDPEPAARPEEPTPAVARPRPS